MGALWPHPFGEREAMDPCQALCSPLQHCGDQLFSVQLTNLLLSVLDYLRGSGPEVLVAAEEVLSAVLQNHAMKVERVRALVAASIPSLTFFLLVKMPHLFLGCLF